jgi:hypothetical protein
MAIVGDVGPPDDGEEERVQRRDEVVKQVEVRKQQDA